MAQMMQGACGAAAVEQNLGIARPADDQPTAGSKVKFSIGKRKQVQKFVETSVKDEEVEGSGDAAPRTIPKLENTWKPEKVIKSEVKEFVGEVLAAGPLEGVQYGLTFAKRKEEAAAGSIDSNARKSGSSSVQKDLLAARERRSKMEKQVLDEHLADLPDPAGFEAYESMPIECFGDALLRGMGWKTGDGIGLSAKADIVPIAYVKRPERLGLGATPAALEERKNKRLKPGDSREKRTDLVAAPGPDGQIRYRVSVDEKLVERTKKGVYGGKVMCVVSGRHSGLRGKVLGDKEQLSAADDKVSIRLQQSGETVTVQARDLAELGSAEEERAMKQDKKSRSKKQNEEPKSWLRSQIRVRIVDKQLEKGKLYCKKGSVMDVVSRTSCDVLMDETNKLHRVEQKHLETVVPKGPGGRVMVLKGEHQGSIAELMERNRNAESAVVRLEQSLELLNLGLDDIAEYTGEAGDM